MSRPKYISMAAAGQLFPRKKSAHSVKTLITKGANGIRLQAIFDGGRYWTTEEWVAEYLTEQTSKRLQFRPEPRYVPWDVVRSL